MEHHCELLIPASLAAADHQLELHLMPVGAIGNHLHGEIAQGISITGSGNIAIGGGRYQHRYIGIAGGELGGYIGGVHHANIAQPDGKPCRFSRFQQPIAIGIDHGNLFHSQIGVVHRDRCRGDEQRLLVGKRAGGGGILVVKGIFQTHGSGLVFDADRAIIAVGMGVSRTQVDVVESVVLQLDLAVTGQSGIVGRVIEDGLEGFGGHPVITVDHIIPFHHIIVLGGIEIGIDIAAGIELQVVPKYGDHGIGPAGTGQPSVPPVRILRGAKGNEAIGGYRSLGIVHPIEAEDKGQGHGLDGSGTVLVTLITGGTGIVKREGGSAAPLRRSDADPVVGGALRIPHIAPVKYEIAIGILTQRGVYCNLADGEAKAEGLRKAKEVIQI